MKESAELKDLAIRYLKARATGDLAFVAGHVSQTDGAVFIGAGRDEWWTGHDAIVEKVRANMSRDIGKASLVVEEPVAYSEGTIGWTTDRFRLMLPDGREMPLVFSAVWRREHGQWRIVLSHLSSVLPGQNVPSNAHSSE